jgi:transketolase
MLTMRDAFFKVVFNYAKNDSNIIILTSDFSAPSFDSFRIELSNQFINTGISEQNSILVAAGLANSGKNVFVTSISPFITMRCFEQIRLYAADMNLSIKIAAVGAGFSYNTAGPTHHSVEDIAILRATPNMIIYSPCCNSQVESFAKICCETSGPAYVRLDRMVLDELYNNNQLNNDAGFQILKTGETTIISTGYMIHTALKVAKIKKIGLIDLFKIPANHILLLDIITKIKHLVIVEEHVLQGGIGSYIYELLLDNGINIPIKRFGFDFSKGFYHRYGSRDEMHSICGIGFEQILSFLES